MKLSILGNDYEPISRLKLTNKSGNSIEFTDLKDTYLLFDSRTALGSMLCQKTINLLIKSDIQIPFTFDTTYSIECEYKNKIRNKNQIYKSNIKAPIGQFKPSMDFVFFNQDEYYYKIQLLISPTSEKHEYCNFTLQECGLKYTKEDSNKKIIVNEPTVQYILKDKKLNKNFRGYAYCLEEDTFDDKQGIEIAKLKAEIQQREYKLNQYKCTKEDKETKGSKTVKPKKFAVNSIDSLKIQDGRTGEVFFEWKK